jgi:hypothetical protein
VKCNVPVAEAINEEVVLPEPGGSRSGLRLRRTPRRDRLPRTGRELSLHIETAIQTFGPERCMMGSDYPPDGSSAGFVPRWNALKHIVRGASHQQKAALFHDRAARLPHPNALTVSKPPIRVLDQSRLSRSAVSLSRISGSRCRTCFLAPAGIPAQTGRLSPRALSGGREPRRRRIWLWVLRRR